MLAFLSFTAMGDDKPSRTQRIVGGIVDIGSSFLDKKKQDDSAAADDGSMIADIIKKSTELAMNPSGTLAKELKKLTEATLREYLEQYKEEGRRYAKELGNTVSERIIEHEKVVATMNNIKMACWGIIIYLTLVSIAIFGFLVAIKRSNDRTQKEIAALRKLLEERQG